VKQYGMLSSAKTLAQLTSSWVATMRDQEKIRRVRISTGPMTHRYDLVLWEIFCFFAVEC
jgi:hypothetical protein